MNSKDLIMKATAKAPGNIAFVKYWGKKDPLINLPENGSLSVCLDTMNTLTTVQFSSEFKEDSVMIDGNSTDRELPRIIKHIDHIRKLANISYKVKMVSQNSFPNSSGLASSASGFAALAVAGSKAAGLDLNEKELSILARLGSGSAARSIPDGYVEWLKGTDNNSSYSYSMFPANHWELAAIAVLITKEKKDVSTTAGHAITTSSPFYKQRIESLPKFISEMKKAIKKRDFQKFGEMLETECLNFVSMSLTSSPYIIYWEPTTIRIMKLCKKLREEGLLAYFTMDAGPQPVIYCLQKDAKKISSRMNQTDGVLDTITCKPTVGTRLIDKHLF
jgi:diphosphomevalonate decarboxylase